MQIKDDLRHDYNIAVDSFNTGDFVSFFRNIRPAIELLCKLLIYEIINSEKDYNDIISGTTSFITSRNGLLKLDKRKVQRPEGGFLAVMYKKAFYLKKPNVYRPIEVSDRRLKLNTESYSSELQRWYSYASALGSHTGKSPLNIEVQARVCSISFSGFFDFIRANKIVSDATVVYLDSLDKFSEYSGAKPDEDAETLKKVISSLEAELADLKSSLAKAHENTDDNNPLLKDKQDKIEKLKQNLTEKGGVIQIPDEKEYDGGSSTEVNKVYKSKNKKLTDKLREAVGEWDVDEEMLDDDQNDLIEKTIDQSMLVTGCAGSGKSVIAMHKADQLASMGYSVILISLTRSLTNFMRHGRGCKSYNFYHYYSWKQNRMPKADFIIVDEIQDFDRNEIEEFINAASKHYMFFGDTAQSIYNHFGKNTLSIEEISEMTNLTPLYLYTNYRLPRNVAKITQNYVGVDVRPYEEKVYQNNDKELPYIVHFDSMTSQTEAIVKLIHDNKDRSVGIFLPSNALVQHICNDLSAKGVEYEYRFKIDSNDKRSIGNLNFDNKLPKVMTYHCAKGLQFDVVIIPLFDGAFSDDDKKALYVAMTRTMHKLYIFYVTDVLQPPLNKVDSIFYKKKIR